MDEEVVTQQARILIVTWLGGGRHAFFLRQIATFQGNKTRFNRFLITGTSYSTGSDFTA